MFRKRSNDLDQAGALLSSELVHDVLQKTFVVDKRDDDDDDEEKEEEEKTAEKIFHRVWEKFSVVHQKSPTHRNNNVRQCGGSSSISARRKTELQSSTRQDMDQCHKLNCARNFFGTVLYILIKTIFFCSVSFACAYCIVVLHKPTQAVVSRNTQDLIYPVMRFFRLLAAPLVRNHPSVSKLYEDSCLVSNPYFTAQDVDCWPCETSKTIVDLTGFSNFSAVYHGSGIPFVVKDAFHVELGLWQFVQISLENQELLFKIYQSSQFTNFEDFRSRLPVVPQEAFGDRSTHIRWKINRVSTVRALRKYFPKPYFIPSTTEVSVQHFLYIDQSESPSYPLPRTEFANVFVTQASGTRLIALVPTEWCKTRCKMLTIVLQPKDVLFYNWLFWRPISAPVETANGNLSITYVGSFY